MTSRMDAFQESLAKMPYGPIGVREHALCQRSFSDGIDYGASQFRGHITQLESQVETLALELGRFQERRATISSEDGRRIADLKSQLENSMQEVRQQRAQIRKWRESSFLENERRLLLTRAAREVTDAVDSTAGDDVRPLLMLRALFGLKATLLQLDEADLGHN